MYKEVAIISRQYKHSLTEYGKRVKTKLVEMDKPQSWLIDEVANKTQMFVDSSLLNKILTGRVRSERITAAIDEILADRKKSVAK
jgi:hypothetical protein